MFLLFDVIGPRVPPVHRFNGGDVITADNGKEFTSKALARGSERGAKIDFTTPGKPTENGFVDSF